MRRMRSIGVKEVSPELRQKIISLYRDERLSAPQVRRKLESESITISDLIIYTILRTDGIPRRHPSAPLGPRICAPGRELWDLWTYGFSQREIARMYRTSRVTVNIRIRDHRAAQAAAGNIL